MRSVISSLIYLARPGDSEEYGTKLYRIDGTPTIDRSNTYYPEQHGYACCPVTAAPFRANSAIAFLNAGAAHGADIPESAPKTTERVAYQFYVSAEPAALASIVEEHTRNAGQGL